MTSSIKIMKSRINGQGVFATRKIMKGEIILPWDMSIVFDRKKLEQLPRKEWKYVTSLDGKQFILLASPERFVNHSCNPNTVIKNLSDVAAHDINEGEEITADYTKEKIPDLYFVCNCRNSNCKKVIMNE